MKCSRCRWNYPDGYVNWLVTSQGGAYLCGICALDVSNEIHGTRRKRFHGEMAEDARQDALEYRRQNPKQAPKGLPPEVGEKGEDNVR